MSSPFSSKEQVFDFLDDYAYQRKEEIDRRQLGRDQGLIKSYLLETMPGNHEERMGMDLSVVLRGTGWQLIPIEGTALYQVHDDEGELGFLEPLSSRHLALHSISETRRADKAIRNTVLTTSQLDFAWLSSSYFQVLWQHLILPQMPKRFVKLRFEHEARFEADSWDGREEESLEEPMERRASSLTITERSRNVAQFLPDLQKVHPPFRVIKMLRIPAPELRGGYDLWSWGKMTYRAPSFRDGRAQMLSIARLYERTTRVIEQHLWFQVKRTTGEEGSEGVTLKGAPVTFTFAPPLSITAFRNFITTTFERGQGPLRLWGNPIWLGDNKAHIYGMDLHLWRRIYLEITPRHMHVILPRGTCGNTVHRLVVNVLRYLTPTAQIFIGETAYERLVEDALLDKGV
ncbi:MAG: hypothetical protein D6759_18020 [Chloroflexi bacterium]|nr:MAG: hypothetical protein D6759_18020 [Chloroflexota bacterium]